LITSLFVTAFTGRGRWPRTRLRIVRGSVESNQMHSQLTSTLIIHRTHLSSRVAHQLVRPRCGLDSPQLRIGTPSPYATLVGGPSVDPAVLQVLRSYPLSRATCYKPKHALGHLVATNTSLAAAQTTPPKTLLSSPKHKKSPKTPHFQPFYTYTSPSETSQPFVKPASRRLHAPDRVRPETQKTHPNPTPKEKATTHPTQTTSPRRTPHPKANPSEGGIRDPKREPLKPQNPRKDGA